MFCFSENEYKKTNDLKRFVIEPAIKEITNQTDLNIKDVQFLKKGRSIHSVYIVAEPKKTAKNNEPRPHIKKPKFENIIKETQKDFLMI